MSKHGGGGRYDGILEFKGEQIKKIKRKKERNMSMCKSKNKVNSPFSKVH
jgi:hypothetical protein